MARGDGGKAIFENDEDRKSFLYRLGQVCGSHGWRIHAWVLINGVRESAGINRLGIENERVLQRTTSH